MEETSWFYRTELVPLTIGKAQDGYSSLRRLDRSLPVGHRVRGDVGL